MQIIINEISVENKFSGLTDFLTHLREIIIIYKLEIENLEILKPSNLYDIVLFDKVKFSDVLYDKRYARDDAIKRYKLILTKMITSDPYWDIDKKHIETDIYDCEFTTKKFDYGIAEAFERDKVVLSFNSEEFIDCDIINVTKNGNQTLNIDNVCSKDTLLELLKNNGKLNPLAYCKFKYQGTNLCFDEFEPEYGFSEMENADIKTFLTAFDQFTQMDWNQITNSDGLKYKSYEPSNYKQSWFKGEKYQTMKIFKFRATIKFRCFGYRREDVFYVLRLEVDHSISDNG
ncbi:hypothetical protein [Sporosarcina ureae]|uniref:hypothetical protein n=1 Tax=Sporosarcina ureae TaxID=1571 RepID=UPI0028AAA649|nr:hypothetical protein [Sporosarcina ureae]